MKKMERGEGMFGQYKHGLDPKGRLVVPSKLREELGDTFYIAKAPDACLKLYPEAQWQKLLDRCNNVSAMADAFSREKLRSYMEETRRYILPMAQRLRAQDASLTNALYLLEYHISSVIFTVEAMLGK